MPGDYIICMEMSGNGGKENYPTDYITDPTGPSTRSELILLRLLESVMYYYGKIFFLRSI